MNCQNYTIDIIPVSICTDTFLQEFSDHHRYVQMQKHGMRCSAIMVLDITLAIHEIMVTILLA